jgi:mannose-1-phosphate guanylyltransferase/mannose-6-phosphate isomerase
MIVVIIAGGLGSRLWPLSTSEYPKHLLKINGDKNSLLQNTYERAKLVAEGSQNVYIVSEVGHIQRVKDQVSDLPEANFIVEPARRGTASCLAAALVRLTAGHGDKEVVTFIAADHYIHDNDGFVRSFKLAGRTAEAEGRIVMIGAEPNYPATGFGYIQKGDVLQEDTSAYNVQSFKEKPDFKTAQTYFDSGQYLWNCSYHVGSIGMFKQAIQTHAPGLFANYQKLKQASNEDYEAIYLGFENNSIECALIEKAENLLVVPANFDWMDLGSFEDLYKSVDRDEQGNHKHGSVETEAVANSFIQNYEDKPLAVIGLDNVVVINTPAGILVTRKDLSQKVGDVSKRLQT